MLERLGGPVEFLFIVLLPVIMVAGGLVTLFAVGALFDALENPSAFADRLGQVMRGRPKPSRMAGPDHYYKPYWSR
jgi:hypothetical protein